MIVNNNVVINNIIKDSSDFLSREQRALLTSVLYGQLTKYKLDKINACEEKYSIYDLVDDFLESKKYQCASNATIKLYKNHLKNFANHFEGKYIQEIKSGDIEVFLYNYKNTHDVTNISVNNMRRSISTFYTWLVQEEYVLLNPVSKVKSLKEDSIHDNPFTEREMEMIAINCNNPRDRALIEFLRQTGCRIGEALSVNIKDIDFEHKKVIVNGKTGHRPVMLKDSALLYIQLYLKTRQDNNNALFVSNKSNYKRLTVSGAEKAIRRIANRADVKNVHPHRYRTTFCCNMINSGADISNVQYAMGHSKIDTTMGYYVKNEARARAAYNCAAI